MSLLYLALIKLLLSMNSAPTRASVKSDLESLTSSAAEGRVFSLFNVVRFPNDECSGTSDTFKGVCLTATECSTKGGSVLGSCAAGFGTCCLIKTSTCGSTVTENCSYIQNPGFPGTYDGSGACNHAIQQVRDDICFLRLDFQTFSTRQPETADATTDGNCLDQFKIIAAVGTLKNTAGNQITPPVICGENAGQHMYVNAGRASQAAIQIQNSFNTGSTFGRTWNIKVSQIPCDALYAPPHQDCTQYFTGLSGTVKSYNFDAPVPYNHLNNQVYHVCIRPEFGRCGVFYSPTSDPNSFMVDNNSNAFSGSAKCRLDYIIIPNGKTPGFACQDNSNPAIAFDTSDRYCGGNLNCMSKETSSPGVFSTHKPFGFKVYFNENENNAANNMDRGFALEYRQELNC